MADETQTDTTETENSTTETSKSDAVVDGGTDAGTVTGDADQGDDDTSLMGKAGAESGDGSDAADGEEGDKDGDDDTAKAADAVPDTYELTLPEGVTLDTELLAEATPVLKELGLTNDQASKLTPLVPKIYERVAKQQIDAFAELRKGWAKETVQDKEIGGKNWPETEAFVAKALDTFGSPSEMKEVDGKMVETNEFRILLNETGLGDHPAMVRMFRAIGQKVGEDTTFARSEAATTTKKSREEILYPDDVPKQ